MKKFYTIVFCLIVTITYAQVPKNGLVGYWKFDNNISDSSGLQHDGIASRNPGYSTDRFGALNAAYLTDSGYVHIPFSNDFNFSTAAKDSFSISLWIYYPSKYGYYGSVFVKEKAGSPSANGSGNYGFSFSDAPGYFLDPNKDDVTLNFEANKWYHMVSIYAEGTVKCYLNNKLDKTVTAEIKTGEEDLIIGNMVSRFPGGKVDDIAIYKRALTLEEIEEIYNYTPVITAVLKADEASAEPYLRREENSNVYEIVSEKEIFDVKVFDGLGRIYDVVKETRISGLEDGLYVVVVQSTTGTQKKIKLQVVGN